MASNKSFVRPSRLRCIAIAALSFSLMPSMAFALDQTELDSNRALWNSFNTSDYDFILGRSCFCDPVTLRPGLVMVRADAIFAVVDAVTHEPRNPQNFFTIDKSFDRIQESLNTPDTVVTAEFDPHLGYPRMFGFDIPQLADDEIIYTISALQIVPEPAASTSVAIALAMLSSCRRVRRDVPTERE